MLNICSLFQKFFGFIKNVDKRVYRTHAIIMSGVVMVSVICLGAKGFGGSGKNVAQNIRLTGTISEENETDVEDDMITASLTPVEKDLVGISYAGYELSDSKAGTDRIAQSEYSNEFVAMRGAVSGISTTQQSAKEVTQVIEPTTEAETQNVEPVTEAVTQNVEPATEPVTEPITEPATEVITEPVTEPETQVVYNSVDFAISENDYYWLCKIVEAEAGNQDEIGKILVANVIINRVESGDFPDTIKSVIFQNNGRTYQFEPVKNERIYDMNPTDNTISCVDRALAGEDYSDGALFFTMKTSGRSWFNTKLTLLFVHGDHYFYTY